MEKMKFHQILFYTFVLIFLTDYQVQGQRVDVEPRNVTVLEGESTQLLCRWGQPLQYCRIEIPGVRVLNLSPAFDKTPGYQYFGEGLDKGQCGVKIQQVHPENHGSVKCFLGGQGDELEGVVDLIVGLKPLPPVFEPMTNPGQNNAFELGQDFVIRCVSLDGRPPAQIEWFLDDEPITEGLSAPEYIERISDPTKNTTVYSVSQMFHRKLQTTDDRRTLICRTSNLADRGRPQDIRTQLRVEYPPQPLPEVKIYGLVMGTTALINVTIRSNPRPHIDWIIDGVSIPERTQNGRYEAYEPIDLGNGFYNITLSIARLTLEDTTKTYAMKASNSHSVQDYIVRISSAEAAAGGLDVGSIVGIVIGIAILIIIISLIVFARATGRWCFGGASLNTDIGPDSEAQITPHQDDFDDKEYEHENVQQDHNEQHHQQINEKQPEVPATKPPQQNGQRNGTSAKGHPSETSDTESAEVKTTKTRKLNLNFPDLFKRKRRDISELDDDIKNKTQNEIDGLQKTSEDDDDDENAAPSEATVIIEDDPPAKNDRNLVYAELMLKPSDDTKNPNKNSTEYAEILCVSTPPTGITDPKAIDPIKSTDSKSKAKK